MLKIYPCIDIHPSDYLPIPETARVSNELTWQGIHICGTAITSKNEEILFDLPVGEGSIMPSAYCTTQKKVYPHFHSGYNWYTRLFKEIVETPDFKEVELKIIRKSPHHFKKIIILNTVDAWYGHSLIWLFHLYRLVRNKPADMGIVLLIQPFIEWLVPADGIYEVWKAGISLSEAKKFYPSLTRKINAQLPRFEHVYLSQPPVLTEGFNISDFTKVPVFPEAGFGKNGHRFTFIWREDANRLWMRNYYVYGVLKILKLQKILLPLQWLRVYRLFKKLHKVWGKQVVFTIAGLGSYGKFPAWISDERVTSFRDAASEHKLCRIYAESEIVAGIHGSSMILPSAHAGMTISLMPPKRWGNFAEDIVFNGEKTFQCLFRKRIVPLNMPLNELKDICISMRTNALSFGQKLIGAGNDVF